MRAATAVASIGRHSLTAIIEAVLVVAIVGALALAMALANHTSPGAESVFAAKGGRLGTSAAIRVPDGTFGGTTTATVSNPGLWVYNACSKGGRIVSQQWAMTDSAGKAVLYLGPSALWTSGSATCVAQVGTWTRKGTFSAQGSTSFNVSS